MTTSRPEPLLRSSMPELDALRGIAVLMVVAYHGLFWSSTASGLSGLPKLVVLATLPGWLGVQLFFVLSGFLITGILLDNRARPDYYSRFYKRRALRILPAYLALLLVLAGLGASRTSLAASLLFASNLGELTGIPIAYGPLWSLAVEEQFYLLWPLAARRLQPRGLALLAAGVVVTVPAVRYVAFVSRHDGGLYSQTWFVADGLALGALAAILLRTGRATRRAVAYGSLACVGVGLSTVVAGARFGILHRTTPLGATFQLAPWHFVFAGMLGAFLVLGSSAWRSSVNSRALSFFGRISYGLYLYHLLVFGAYDSALKRWWPQVAAQTRTDFTLLLARLIIAGGAAVLLAVVSRQYLEEFFLKLRDSNKIRRAPGSPLSQAGGAVNG